MADENKHARLLIQRDESIRGDDGANTGYSEAIWIVGYEDVTRQTTSHVRSTHT